MYMFRILTGADIRGGTNMITGILIHTGITGDFITGTELLCGLDRHHGIFCIGIFTIRIGIIISMITLTSPILILTTIITVPGDHLQATGLRLTSGCNKTGQRCQMILKKILLSVSSALASLEKWKWTERIS